MATATQPTEEAMSLVEALAFVPEQFRADILQAIGVAAQSYQATRDHEALEHFAANLTVTLGLLAKPDFVKQYTEAVELEPVESSIGIDGWVERLRERVEA